MSDPIRVIYIAGCPDSGSTLLSLLLGAHRQVTNVGEAVSLAKLFESAARQGRLCRCGAELLSCPLWRKVIQSLARSYGDSFAERLDPRHVDFSEANWRLFDAALSATGAQVICDSSKNIDRMNRLAASPKIHVHAVHLVRDGRAYACSVIRKGQSSFAHERDRRRELVRQVRAWSTVNRHARREVARLPNHHFVRYEDLVLDPQGVIGGLIAELGLEPDNVTETWTRRAQHLLGGNAVGRLQQKVIAPDVRFLSSIDALLWSQMSLRAWQGLWQFGYPLRKSQTQFWPHRLGRTYQPSDGAPHALPATTRQAS